MTLDQYRLAYRTDIGPLVGIDNVVDSWGEHTARIVQIGQAPSIAGAKIGKPWADKSGQKLRDKWYLLTEDQFYNKNNFYFTAMGMYFPGKDKNGGDLRPSLELAKKWLPIELAILKPQLIILIGKMAADFFFPGKNFKELILNDQEINGVKTIVLPHPSPLNIKWFKDNPEFEQSRLGEIRSILTDLIS